MNPQFEYPPSLNGVDEGAFHVIELVEITQSTAHYRVRMADTRILATMVVMKHRLSDLDEDVKAFTHDIRLVNERATPANCKVLGHGRSSRTGSYIIYEYTEGVSLERRLREQGSLSTRGATSLLRCLAAALHDAHDHGVVHGALSTDNIMLVPMDSRLRMIKILGYGISRLLCYPFINNTTHPGVVEQLIYTSPEQCAGGPATARSDVYSLGVMAYEMLYGRPPFTGETSRNLIQKHLHAPPPRPKLRGKQVPDRIVEVVFKALAKRPLDRFSSMADFRQALPVSIPPELRSTGEGLCVRLTDEVPILTEPPADDVVPLHRDGQADERVSRLVDEMIQEDITSPPPFPVDLAGEDIIEVTDLDLMEMDPEELDDGDEVPGLPAQVVQEAEEPEPLSVEVDLQGLEEEDQPEPEAEEPDEAEGSLSMNWVPGGFQPEAKEPEPEVEEVAEEPEPEVEEVAEEPEPEPKPELVVVEPTEDPEPEQPFAPELVPEVTAVGSPPTFRTRNVVGFCTVMLAAAAAWIGVVMLLDWSNEAKEHEEPTVTGQAALIADANQPRLAKEVENTAPIKAGPAVAATAKAPLALTAADPTTCPTDAPWSASVGKCASSKQPSRVPDPAPVTSALLPGLEAVQGTSSPEPPAVLATKTAEDQPRAKAKTRSSRQRRAKARAKPRRRAAARRVKAKRPVAAPRVETRPAPAATASASAAPSKPAGPRARAASSAKVPPLLLRTFKSRKYRTAFYTALIHLEERPKDPQLLAIKGVSACHLNMGRIARQVHARLRGIGRRDLEQACTANGIALTR